MPTMNGLAALPRQIQQLLEQRQQHADAITAIDATLARVNAALDAKSEPAATQAAAVPASPPPAAKGKKRRRRRRFATTAEELILAFVKANKNPTTQEIERHWQGEGRGAAAATTLSHLTKDKTLKRTPLGEGIQGSRYSIA